MLRRLLNDKEIGRKIINKKCYSIKPNDWDAYNNSISNKYSRDYINNTNNTNNTFISNSALSDSVINMTYDINTLKMDIIKLHSRINKLTNVVDQNHNELSDSLLGFSLSVKEIIDEVTNNKNVTLNDTNATQSSKIINLNNDEYRHSEEIK